MKFPVRKNHAKDGIFDAWMVKERELSVAER
jgi:hypothetical protein